MTGRWAMVAVLAVAVVVAVRGTGSSQPASGQGGGPAASGRAADPVRGATIVQQGTQAGAPPCQTCHGAAGDGTGSSPRLYGQAQDYLLRQLHDFTSAVRPSDIMTPVAGALSADDMADTAAYYATHREEPPAPPQVDAAVIQRGHTLAAVGDNAKSVPACNNCHGPGGIGEPPYLPALAEQFAPYIVAQLQAWRGDKRKSGAPQMGPIAKRLDPSDFEAVAAYYAQVRIASPAANAQ
jgi:cytochrome c553